MGYPHITTDLNLSHQYSFNNAKPNASSSPPSSNCHACPNPTSTLFALTHAHLANSFVADVGSNKGAELSNEQQQPLGSSRWNPTAEQLLALEELYRRGTRTPSAAQIQQIATRLRRFGKIEGKNVFYWFQNHKARERQKRRREVLDTDLPQQSETQTLDNKEPAAGSCCEIEQTKNKVPYSAPSNFSKLSEEFNSMHGGIATVSESGPKEWIQINQEKELQKQRKNTVTRSVSTWETETMGFSCLNSSTNSSSALNSINEISCLMKPHQQKIITTLEDENREEQTLELFPLGRSNYNNGINISNNKIIKEDTQVPIRVINTSFTTQNLQFFEFLPLKN